MKRMIALLISVYIPCVIIAQVQKGIVRSQSFVSKAGTRIVGAKITRSGNNVNSVVSLGPPKEGYFELPMSNLGKSKVYYISSVKAPKGTEYELMYPLPDDKLEFTPNAPLTIIMKSNDELKRYASQVEKDAYSAAKKELEKDKQLLEEQYKAKQLTLEEKEKELETLQKKFNAFQKLMPKHLFKILEGTDFESLDSLHKASYRAIEAGKYKLADSLLNLRPDSVWIKNCLESKNRYEREEKLAIDNFNQKIQSALCQLNFEEALNQMKNRLILDSTNVNYLCQIGELLEIRYNNYPEALSYYQKALSNASNVRNTDDNDIAICHNHLGDVYNAIGNYELAEQHYNHACNLLEHLNDNMSKGLYDSYLGLANIRYVQANFEEALAYYKKCAASDVELINGKAFWQGRIGIGQIKRINNYHEARADLTSILKNIKSTQNIDIATLSMAYSSMIDILTTYGQFQEAIDSCDSAIKIIKSYSSPKNTYIATLLISKGNAYMNIGKIRDGIQCINDAREIYKNILGEDHPNYAYSCVLFADYYNLIGELNKSEEMSNKALDLFNKKFGENHPVCVGAHTAKFNLWKTRAEFGKAQAEIDTIRTIYKAAGLMNDYNRTLININEAAMKIEQGDQLKGIKIFQEAIDCISNTLGNESFQLISIYNQIASVYLEQLEDEKAKVFLDKAQSLANKIYGNNTPAAIIQQLGMGQYYTNQGKYHKAYELYSKIEKVAVNTYGEDNYRLCGLYSMLGDYHLGQYHFDKAKYYYEKIYEIVKNTYGENHYFVAVPITKIGAYYMNMGELYKGLEKEQQAYNILSNHFGIGHKATLQSLLGICTANIQLGKYDQAESVLTELSKAIEKEFGKKHWSYSNVLQIKANLYEKKGEFSKAIVCIEEAISIVELQYGEKHSNTINLYNQLGGLYLNLCNVLKAIEYNDIAIDIATNYYGKGNVGVMPFLLNKGQICAGLNKIKDAHELYNKVKSAYNKHFGDSCMQLNNVLISEAKLLTQEGYGEQALEILKNVETRTISMYGENSFNMCEVYNSLADTYKLLMQYNDARGYYQKSIDIIKTSFGENNVNCIYPLVGLGNVCISEDVSGQQIEDARRFYNQASFIASTVFGSNNLNTANIDADLGQISLRQRNLQDAYNKFQKHFTIVRRTLGESISTHTTVANAHMNMGYYYLAKANELSWKLDSISMHHFAVKAMEEFEKAKIVIETIYGKECAAVANTLNAIAQTHFTLLNPEMAIATYVKASELTIKQFGKDSPLAAQAYSILGAAYNYESDQIFFGDEDKLNKAKEFYIKAIRIREGNKGNSKRILMMSTMDWRMNLSEIYMKLCDYENAFKTIDKIIYELENLQLNNKNALYTCFYKKASMILESERNPEEALELLIKAEELFSKITFPNKLMEEMQYFQLLYTFGAAYEKTGSTNKAIKSYENAYKKLGKFPNNPQVETMKQSLRIKIEELNVNSL